MHPILNRPVNFPNQDKKKKLGDLEASLSVGVSLNFNFFFLLLGRFKI